METTPPERKLKEFSRQQLYDLIWSKPIAEVAVDFGVAETTVKNHCNNRRVPCPARRYWRAIALGGNPRKKPLPSTDNETFENELQKPMSKSLALPKAGAPLHPLAAAMLVAMKKIKPDYKSQICFRDVNYPEVHVTRPLLERTAQVFHVLLNALEPLGIEFKKYAGSHDSGYFKRGKDRLIISFEEVLYNPLDQHRRIRWFETQQGFTVLGPRSLSHL